MNLSRRTFISMSKAVMGSILFKLNTPVFALENSIPTLSLNRYIQLNADGSIIYIDTKPEMGQGSGTGIAMIVCEELGADWSKFDIQKPPLTNCMSPIEFSLDSGWQ
ncbi:MAG: hypothetical protein MJK04_21745 [Psychrosphaera sp.]|nr:hypothetical protein [Psychrosphaera sp.]